MDIQPDKSFTIGRNSQTAEFVPNGQVRLLNNTTARQESLIGQAARACGQAAARMHLHPAHLHGNFRENVLQMLEVPSPSFVLKELLGLQDDLTCDVENGVTVNTPDGYEVNKRAINLICKHYSVMVDGLTSDNQTQMCAGMRFIQLFHEAAVRMPRIIQR